MKVRFLGNAPADNGDLGYIIPDGIYEVPAGRESAFMNHGEWEVVKESRKSKKEDE